LELGLKLHRNDVSRAKKWSETISGYKLTVVDETGTVRNRTKVGITKTRSAEKSKGLLSLWGTLHIRAGPKMFISCIFKDTLSSSRF
jgi:hypothetical protein